MIDVAQHPLPPGTTRRRAVAIASLIAVVLTVQGALVYVAVDQVEGDGSFGAAADLAAAEAGREEDVAPLRVDATPLPTLPARSPITAVDQRTADTQPELVPQPIASGERIAGPEVLAVPVLVPRSAPVPANRRATDQRRPAPEPETASQEPSFTMASLDSGSTGGDEDRSRRGRANTCDDDRATVDHHQHGDEYGRDCEGPERRRSSARRGDDDRTASKGGGDRDGRDDWASAQRDRGGSRDGARRADREPGNDREAGDRQSGGGREGGDGGRSGRRG